MPARPIASCANVGAIAEGGTGHPICAGRELMFFPDKVAAFREALRVLRPGSRFLFSVWGSREGSVADVVVTVVGQFLSRDPEALVAPPYNDVATVQADLAAAGFASITAEDVIQS